ncbi:MAG: hypothetical protein ABI621_01540 [Chloroflexota bacterium]
MENPPPLETPQTIQKAKRFLLPASVLIVVLIIAAAGIYTWMYLYNPCEVSDVEDASAFLVSQLKTYDASYQFAATVYRVGLTRPVNDLQQIFMDTQAVAVPACMQTAKKELLHYMGAVISAFQAYMQEETEPKIRGLLNQSNTHYDNFTTELEAVKECAPFCAPWD